eukprot:c5080_g1_i1 orf=120-746(+)
MICSIEDGSGGSFLSPLNTIPHNSTKKTKRSERLDSLDLLWRQFFSDPSQWWDIRKSKRDSRSPDFRNKTTKESLWIHGWYTPDWVEEELGKQGLQLADNLHGDLAVEEETKTKKEWQIRQTTQQKEKVRQIHRTTQQEEDALICGKDNLQNSKGNSVINLIASLQVCAKTRNLQKGSKIHSDIVRKGSFEDNIFVATTLVNMYGKCG